MYYYWGYGLNITSEIEFPELLPHKFDLTDIIIKLGETPNELTGQDVLRRTIVSISPNEYLLKIFNIANYYAVNGNTIIVEPLSCLDKKSLRLFLLSNAMAAILHQRDLVSLHASGVFYNNGVILFCGPTGAGKSTLVSTLQHKGYTVFTDDVCTIQYLNNTLKVVPSYPVISLWEDSFYKIGIELPSKEKRIRPEMPKYEISYHNNFVNTAQMIKGIFILNVSNKITSVEMKEENNISAFSEIQKNIYKPLQMNAMKKRNTLFQTTASLTKTAKIYTLTRPDYINSLESLTSHIIPFFI